MDCILATLWSANCTMGTCDVHGGFYGIKASAKKDARTIKADIKILCFAYLVR